MFANCSAIKREKLNNQKLQEKDSPINKQKTPFVACEFAFEAGNFYFL
jgi:hypothetical protein